MESSSKRARAPGNITQVAHCLVDGCNADLSICRDYHRRHKVCEAHSKTPTVTIGGREQRFCQQCSRFHSLVEFDEGKRSCRKRLDGHNRRRRKPQPERNPGLDFSSQHGPTGTTTTSLLSFTTPQILPSSVVGFSWSSGVVKPENEMALYTSPHQQMNYIERPNSFPKHSSPQSYNRGAANNQLHFNIQEATSNNMSQAPLLDPKMYSDGLNHHSSDDRALSLLSSTPTRELGLSHHMVRGEPQLPLAHDLDYGGLGQFHHELADQESCKPVVCSSTTMDSRGNSGSTVHFPGMLEHGAEGSSASGSHQTLTFMWE